MISGETGSIHVPNLLVGPTGPTGTTEKNNTGLDFASYPALR
ncbi:hypothetical protein AIN02nite_29690 [Acetobacter indonesiensis]|uniref:Uncharacterized protein n=1 Tax=Acetobacter indonesiensis TaxID=104101 RepID=A0A6N3T9N1_9PROT|nr:hypothetical protein Abin_045_002 [Acetobacter indonesiensis]GEN04944.1 hypothetical protein AIN02nite_29690 [Acetobacter indonesiensis]